MNSENSGTTLSLHRQENEDYRQNYQLKAKKKNYS